MPRTISVANNSGSWGGGSLASAILKCRNAGADIINMSLGSESFSSTEAAILQDLYDNDGIAIVAAAGNDGNSVRSYPASYPTVISVAAIDNELEQAADFSQTPPSSFDPANPPANSEWDTVELAGGGVQVLSTVPRPNGDVPTYMAKVGNEAYYGGRVTGHTDPAQGEYMPEGDVTGVLVDGGLCLSGSGDASWDGAIVACQRGNGTFADKVNAVRARSGRAVVIYNNIPGDLSATCASNCTQPSIPAVSLSLSKGQALLAAAGQPARVVIDDGSGCTNCDGGYDFMSGTSMASPGVTGALALLWNACGGPQQLPNKTLRLLARESAKDLAGVQPGQNIVYGAGPDRVTGWGMPQVSDAMELGPAYGANCALNLSVTPASMEVCTQQTASVDFTASLGDRFQGSATLSVAGAPQGAQGGFSINPIVHPQKHSTYTLANLDQAAAGLYPLDFSVQDDAAPNIASMAAANLTVRHAAPSAPSTTSPGAGAIGVSPIATLQWQAAADASIYDVTVATDAQFNDIVFTAQTTATQVTTSLLLPSTTYFWRVRADNGCGNGPVSIAASFMTGTTTQQTQCFTSAVAIPDGTAAGVTTQIVVPAMSGTIVDLNLRLEATHGWTGDLVARLTRVGGTTATVLDRPGYPVAGYGCSANNPALTLDDEGNAGSAESQCASGTNSTAYDPNARYTPSMPLSAFDGSAFAGTWTLNVSDLVLGDAGALTRWCLDATTASSSNGNVPPSFDAAEYHFTVNEGDPVGTVVGTVVAHDADDAALQFDIVEGNADGAFMLDAVSGVLTVASVTHAPTVDVVHTMVVRVRDGRGGESRVDVEVRVLAADGVIMADGFE